MKIESYSFGKMKVGSTVYSSDLLIYNDEVNDSWWRKKGHRVSLKDLEWLLKKNPDYIIIGKGNPGLMKVPGNVIEALEKKGIEIFVGSTKKAVSKFNSLSDKNINIGAGFHLTC